MIKTIFFLTLLLVSPSIATLRAAGITQGMYDAGCMCIMYKAFILLVADGYGKVSPDFLKNLAKIQSLCKDTKSISGIVVPCPKCDPRAQVREIADALKTGKISMVYIFVTAVNWSSDVQANRKFFQEFMDEYYKCGIPFAIGTGEGMWNYVMGADYTEYSRYPLMYIIEDNDPNNNNFKPFGGWIASQVIAKKYHSLYACNQYIFESSLYLY